MACVMSAMIFAACSNQVSDMKKALNTYEKAIDKAEKCEELTNATKEFEKTMKEIDEKYKDADTTKISKEDKKAIEDLMTSVGTKLGEKTVKLCK